MSLAALEALMAGVKVRCQVVERDGIVAKVYSFDGVDIGRRLVSAGVAYRRYSKAYVNADNEAQGQARDVAGHALEWRAWSPPQASTPSAPAGTRRQPAGS
jgi:endonuclease YncB( thermonuclease family)